jgi:putative DNA primase/helicase
VVKKVDTAELINIATRDIKANNKFITLNDTGDIYSWHGDIWVNNGEIKIRELAELALDNANIHIVSEIVEKIKRQTYISRDKLNQDDKKITLLNCVLDLETGKTADHDPDLYQTIQLPVKYDPAATCPAIDKFVHESMMEFAPLFYEILAYCLIPAYRFKKFFIFLGEANTGKTTAIDVMYRFIGQKNTSELTLQTLADNRFALANLYGKLANICDDLPKVELKDVGRIKELTGNSPVHAEIKFIQKGISYVNRAKLIFTCNKIPPTQGSDEAFYSRLLIVPFRFKPLQQDNDLIAKLTSESEMSGLLNKVLKARKTMFKNNGFSITQTTEEVAYLYNLGSLDTVTKYAHDRLEYDTIGRIIKEDLYADYMNFCNAIQLPYKELNSFHRKIQDLGYNDIARVTVGDERKAAYMGIKFRE